MAAMNITDQQFFDLAAGDKPVLVDFWAPWCGYCRRIAASYDKLAEQYGDRVSIVKINIDENTLLANQEKVEVIPTLILYKNGQAAGTIVAPESKAAMESFLREQQVI